MAKVPQKSLVNALVEASKKNPYTKSSRKKSKSKLDERMHWLRMTEKFLNRGWLINALAKVSWKIPWTWLTKKSLCCSWPKKALIELAKKCPNRGWLKNALDEVDLKKPFPKLTKEALVNVSIKKSYPRLAKKCWFKLATRYRGHEQ